MKYLKSERYMTQRYLDKIMGPNPVKLTEELLQNHAIAPGALVMDLGSGQGLTSVFLAREYGFRVIAADLWSDPTENRRFFSEEGLTDAQILPIHADANALPFAHETFDAVVTTDSYNYFGRDPSYLGERLLPFIKHGGLLYIAIPGMRRDCHDDLPPVLLLSWTPEQMEYMHDAAWWRALIGSTPGICDLSVTEMEGNEEVWNDWLACDNEYAAGDRRAMEAGAGKYLNFLSIVLRRE